MKRVTANMLTYDASVGRVEPGGTYLVEDDKAERWIQSGIAVPAAADKPTPPPEPEDEGDEEPEQEDDEPSDPVELATRARALFDEGKSERAIAQQLGISRTRVHSLLQS
jgi:DNA-binding NarL/FixJ family response regulator